MKDGAFRPIWADYRIKTEKLREDIEKLRAERDAKLRELEAQCIREHGSHNDDGGMFFGSCTRCGFEG